MDIINNNVTKIFSVEHKLSFRVKQI